MMKDWGQRTGHLGDMGWGISRPHGDGMTLSQVSGGLVFPWREAPARLTSGGVYIFRLGPACECVEQAWALYLS